MDQLLAQEDLTESLSSPDRILWPLTDHLQTTRDLIDNAGDLRAHYQYDSFGQILSGDTTLTRYLFTAREHDPATNLNYHRARHYGPTTGKWLSEDPIGFEAGDANFVRYAGNRPVQDLKFPVLVPVPHSVEAAASTRRKADVDSEGGAARVTGGEIVKREKNKDGSTSIYIYKLGTIVILLGHGHANTPHHVYTRDAYQAACFVGCDALATNQLIDPRDRLPGAKMTNGGLVRAPNAARPEDTTKYWTEKAFTDARKLAKKWFKSNPRLAAVNIMTVKVYDLPNSSIMPSGWQQPADVHFVVTPQNVDTIEMTNTGTGRPTPSTGRFRGQP